jgi:hypothetical protein
MEQLKIRVPYWFIRQKTRLDWHEAKRGLEEEILEPQDVIEVARDSLLQGEDTNYVVALASSGADEPLLEIVTRLASGEALRDPRTINRKWAFLLLAWVFEHRTNYADPLDIVEKLYADLEYPEQVAPLVRYMPTDEPDLGSKERNERRLFGKWADYLLAEGAVHSQA